MLKCVVGEFCDFIFSLIVYFQPVELLEELHVLYLKTGVIWSMFWGFGDSMGESNMSRLSLEVVYVDDVNIQRR